MRKGITLQDLCPEDKNRVVRIIDNLIKEKHKKS